MQELGRVGKMRRVVSISCGGGAGTGGSVMFYPAQHTAGAAKCKKERGRSDTAWPPAVPAGWGGGGRATLVLGWAALHVNRIL